MNLSSYKKLKIDGIELKKLTINGILAWKSGYKNWVKYSTEADGVTIYNGGLGYKDGYRVRSGGAEATQYDTSITGYIPVKGGGTVRLSGYDAKNSNAGAGNAINVYDASFANLGQAVNNRADGYGIFLTTYPAYGWSSVKEETTGVYVWKVPPDSNIAYMRVTGYTLEQGNRMIVTVNEEIA